MWTVLADRASGVKYIGVHGWSAHWARLAASAPDSLTAVCPEEKSMDGLTLTVVCVASSNPVLGECKGTVGSCPWVLHVSFS